MTAPRALLVTVLAAVLTACGTAVAPGSGSTPASAAPSRTSCGVVTLGQGTPRLPRASLTCFTAALADGRRVTLTVTRPTSEGDPITTTYTTVDRTHVELAVDSTQDTFAGAGAGVSRQRCAGPTVTDDQLDFASCTDVPAP